MVFLFTLPNTYYIVIMFKQEIIQEIITCMQVGEGGILGEYEFFPLQLEVGALKSQVEVTIPQIKTGSVQAKLRFGELEREDVNRVIAENVLDIPILVLPGLILEGGKQTRAVQRAFIINPHTSHEIPVNCIEQGRWSYRDHSSPQGAKQFKSKGLIRQGIREVLINEMGQHITWNAVEQVAQIEGVAREEAPSMSYYEIEKKVAKKKKEQRDTLKKMLQEMFSEEKYSGFILREKEAQAIRGFELFVKPDLWNEAQEFFVDSIINEITSKKIEGLGKLQRIKFQDLNDFKDSLLTLKIKEATPIGDEVVAQLENKKLKGWIIGFNAETPIHLSLTQKRELIHYDLMGGEESINVIQEQTQSFDQFIETSIPGEQVQRRI